MPKKIITFLSLSLAIGVMVAAGLSYVFTPILAGSDENTSGYAWSENIGWISFNNTSDGSSVNYGVNINSNNGKLSGYAWSENIGWISFNESDLSGCPISPCVAKVDSPGDLGIFNVDVNGWARALAYGGGWDGWIKLDHGKSGEVYIDSNGNWHGWAWGDTVVGWLSFNNDNVKGGGINYRVVSHVNHPPQVTNQDVTKQNYCTNPSHHFSWTYSDPDEDAQSKYQFQVDNNSNFSSPVVNRSENNPSTNEQMVVVSVMSGQSGKLDYDTTYYWRVKVWDSQGANSGWVEGPSFSTEKHRYPSIDFDWIPQEPNEEEEVQFTDQSTVYGGATKQSWSWTFEDGNPATSNQQNPTVKFSNQGEKDVGLSVTDSDGYSCSISKIINIKKKVPSWKEILPW